MKNKALVITAIILGVVAIYLIVNNKKGTIKRELTDFAVEDTASIHKIFLADKNNNHVTLERNDDGSWNVNNKYTARKDAIRVLLQTLRRMEVKTPVAKAAKENVIKNIASNNIKVELYEKNESTPFKVIYVGGETPDHLGTYMLLENSSAPFVLHIPGFNGYLSSRFIVKEEGWRDRTIFNYPNPFEYISSISLEILDKPQESFKIELVNGQIKSVSKLKSTISIEYDTAKVMAFVSKFNQLNFESVVKGLDPVKADSIQKAVPLYIVSVKEKSGSEKIMIMHPMAANPGEVDMDGKALKYNLDRFYAQIISSQGKDFVIAQYYVFDRILKPLSFFERP